jgi:hypothetical protein
MKPRSLIFASILVFGSEFFTGCGREKSASKIIEIVFRDVNTRIPHVQPFDQLIKDFEAETDIHIKDEWYTTSKTAAKDIDKDDKIGRYGMICGFKEGSPLWT